MDGRRKSPGLESGSLLAYLDGALDEETRRQVEAILAEDAATTEELSFLAGVQEGLRRGLKATARPSAHELGEYLFGLLSAPRAKAIEAQAAADPAVAEALAQLRAYLSRLDLPHPAAAKPGPSLAQRIAVYAGRLAGSGQATPAPAAVRGLEAGPVTYEAGDYQVILQAQEDPAVAGRRSLFGLLTGGDLPAGLSAELYHEDELAASSPVDELGNFTFADLSPAVYDLLLHGSTLEIVLPDINVG